MTAGDKNQERGPVPEGPTAARRPPKVPRPVPAPRISSPRLDALATGLRASDPARARAARADLAALLEEPWPLLGPPEEGHQIVTFLHRDDDAEQVLLFANRLTDEANLEDTLLERLPGTDLWHASFRMRTDWRASYCFVPARPGERPSWISAGNHRQLRAALDSGVPDPRNPRTAANRAGRPMSVVELADAPPRTWTADYDASRTADWQTAPGGQRLAVRSAPGAGPESPVLLVFDGEVWLAQGLLEVLHEAVRDRGLAPVHVVLLDSGGREKRWQDLGGDRPVAETLAEQVLPYLVREHGWTPDPARTCAVGQSLGGLSALQCALDRPDAVGRVVSHSASLWQTGPQEALAAREAAGTLEELAGLEVWAAVGDQEWVLTGPHETFLAQLAAAPVAVRARRYNGGHDYACWREGLVPALAELFPAPSSSPRQLLEKGFRA